MEVVTRKKLIEVGLPLEKINEAASREKSIRHGHPSTLHLWWARRPSATARAVIFAQMVDDPSSHPERFKTVAAQEKERQRLFRIIEELVLWENTANERVLDAAREEILESWRRTCDDNRHHSLATELFNPKHLPAFHDPFAGGGALPLEAQRLGLKSYASDLNPVAVLINKASIEIPPKFAGSPPVNPDARKTTTELHGSWRGASGLAEDVRYYGRWIHNEALKRIGHLYPTVEVTEETARERPDLRLLVGKKLTVNAWLWARTVKSPNPAYANVNVPLVSSFLLSTNGGNEAYIEPVVGGDSYRLEVRVGTPPDAIAARRGTKLAHGANFRCLMSDAPIGPAYIKAEGKAGRMGTRLLALAADGVHGRVYLSPTPEQEAAAHRAAPDWEPEGHLVEDARAFTPTLYGLGEWKHLFTARQLTALTTITDLVAEARDRAMKDGVQSSERHEKRGIEVATAQAKAYSDAISTYLAFAVDKCADYWNTNTTWMPRGTVGHLFARHAIAMTWDFPEANPLAEFHCAWKEACEWVCKAIAELPAIGAGSAQQADAATQTISLAKVVSTDPPYYDNVPYADLSDFFYVWLRRSLLPVFPNELAMLAVPKRQELVAVAYRNGNDKRAAERFFLHGMTDAMRRIADQAHHAFPISIYYAFKQAESDDDGGDASTGWETFLEAVLRAGLAIGGTWPMRTERAARSRGLGSNALASSIVLVCRPRLKDAPIATRREFVSALKAELPIALVYLQSGNIAPVDLAQSAIGPGMAVFTRYAKVLETDGSPMRVRGALQIINQELDGVLSSADTDYDADTRWALKWFEQFGNEDGPSGDANTLANATNVGVNGLEEAGIVVVRGSKVRLLRRSELHGGAPLDWDPTNDQNIPAWEAVQHIIHRHQVQAVPGAAALVAVLGSRADVVKDLAYRLYSICERKKWQVEALAYNALVAEWNDIVQASTKSAKPAAGSLFG